MGYTGRHPIGIFKNQQIVFIEIPNQLFSIDIQMPGYKQTDMEPFSRLFELIMLFLELKTGPR